MFGFDILGFEAYYVLWVFFYCAFLGVVLETVYGAVRDGVLDSRAGMLYLPLNPLYGIGGTVLALALAPQLGNPPGMFGVGVVVGSAIEYTASWVMEKAFGATFWDYRDEPLNLHGRICAKYALMWGGLGLILMFVLERYVRALTRVLPREVGEWLLLALLVAFVLAAAITLLALVRFRRRVAALTDASAPARAASALPLDPDAVAGDRGFWRVIGRLAPDRLVVFTLPQLRLVDDYAALTGTSKIGWRFSRAPLAAALEPPAH